MAWDKDLDKKTVAYKIASAAGDRIRVIAGPGTGKSYAMKRRVARLLEEDVDPKAILAVTFTRVAAEDLHRELQNYRCKPYVRLRDHCEKTGDSPWDALEKMVAGTLKLKYTDPLVAQFKKIKQELDKLAPHKGDVPKLIDELFPANMESIAELRELALTVAEEVEDAEDLFFAMMKEITQPDIPPEVKEVRVMSLHKSKGLSSPYVFIAQCVQGVLPSMPKPNTPKAAADAAREEQRRLFFVGITRVKAGPDHPGTLYLSYPKEMPAFLAKQLDIPFTKVNYGQAQLTPSIFIGELGPKAPAPFVGEL